MFNHLINLAKESHFNRYNTNEEDDESNSQEKPKDNENLVVVNQVYECFNNGQKFWLF